MIEYPSILKPSRAPHLDCISFDKLDGSNIRVKFTPKKGFDLFGSREQLFDETHPFLAGAIPSFRERYQEFLLSKFQGKEFSKAKEIICFGEYFGDKSFAGYHDPTDPTKKFVLFDILMVYKDRYEFMKPQDFIRFAGDHIEIPRVIYQGKMGPQFIQDVRDDKYDTKEGVISKGTEYLGQYRGKIWMAKVKTTKYLNSLKNRFQDDWERYAE